MWKWEINNLKLGAESLKYHYKPEARKSVGGATNFTCEQGKIAKDYRKVSWTNKTNMRE